MRQFTFLSFVSLMLVLGCGQTSAETNLVKPPEVTNTVEVSTEGTSAALIEVSNEVEVSAEQVITPLGARKGSPDAKVVLVEYFSPTCGACQQFHSKMMPVIQSEYIDTGKIIFEYRDYPLNQVDIAAYALARCSESDQGYFDVIDDFFKNQAGIREAVKVGAGKTALQTIGARHGVEGDQAFDACINNEAIRDAIGNAADSGRDLGVSGTPTFLVNGTMHKYSEFYSETQLRVILDNALDQETANSAASGGEETSSQ